MKNRLTDTELIDIIQQYVDLQRLGCKSASVKIQAQERGGGIRYRVSDRQWADSLREAIAAPKRSRYDE